MLIYKEITGWLALYTAICYGIFITSEESMCIAKGDVDYNFFLEASEMGRKTLLTDKQLDYIKDCVLKQQMSITKIAREHHTDVNRIRDICGLKRFSCKRVRRGTNLALEDSQEKRARELMKKNKNLWNRLSVGDTIIVMDNTQRRKVVRQGIITSKNDFCIHYVKYNKRHSLQFSDLVAGDINLTYQITTQDNVKLIL